jgi:hypothetical protein
LSSPRRVSAAAALGLGAPQLRRALEDTRARATEQLLRTIAFEKGGEALRQRKLGLAGSGAEQRRLLRLFAVQRTEARERVIQQAMGAELALVNKMRALGIRTLAQLVDAEAPR